jgi:hypothetical protein
MPRIPDYIAECSVYLYRTVDAAREAQGSGGSGFLVQVPSEIPGFVHLYAVTNKHVIDGNCVVLRLNNKAGSTDLIETKVQDWFTHPDLDIDLVVFPIQLGEKFKWWAVDVGMFLTREIINAYRVGYGDEAFLVGRLITHDGRQKNAPVIRFGYISLMADEKEPIRTEGREQEGFLVDCRSLSGFSGSPVFVTTTQNYVKDSAERLVKFRQEEMGHKPEQTDDAARTQIVSMQGTFGPWLLGIDWGHIPLWKHVYDESKQNETNYWVESNTGVACVLPAWCIRELLDTEELVKERRRSDKEAAKQIKKSTLPDS